MRIKFEYKMVSVYLLVGCLWILFSDHFIEIIFPDPQEVSRAQTYKGWFYVLVTAIIFYYFLRRYLKRLRATEQKALESDRLKSAFLANMSQEVRNPMNGIIGFSKLLLNPDISGEQKKECVKVIEDSGRQMLSIINDLLALSHLESGKMSLHISDVEVNSKMRYIYDLLKRRAEYKKINFLLHLPENADQLMIKTDKDKLSYVVRHLLQNAIKNTQKGTIEFGYRKKGKELCFFVKDTGVGIPKDQLKIIFVRFMQADQSTIERSGGLGLGLSVSKAYIEALGGHIWAESEEGVGSVFYFTLPIRVHAEKD
ncbi:MAG: HAMP domain-containing sensor histidine kinase [Bacteroidales bacterium]|nr:HAMP domain-containing sensor histidine kinase [Bacteroidales bacterium]